MFGNASDDDFRGPWAMPKEMKEFKDQEAPEMDEKQ
jgi:hypothetical protein